MAISDFRKTKKIDVASVSGTPTISKAQPLKITSGDDSTTGTGQIVIDFANISDKSDIGVYDENDNLLDYYFESFDATAETAVIWVYRDWVRDGSTQAKIGYGNGPSDQSVAASTVFDKETNLQAGYLFNESSGDLLDVTSNNNDGTLNGGVTQGASGVVDGSYGYDGSDDYVEANSVTNDLTATTSDSSQPFTVSTWVYLDGSASGDRLIASFESSTSDEFFTFGRRSGYWDFYSNGRTAEGAGTGRNEPKTDEWIYVVMEWDGTYLRLYENNQQVYEVNPDGDGTWMNDLDIFYLGLCNSFPYYWDGKIDDVHIYDRSLSSYEPDAKYDASKFSPDFFSQQTAEGSIDLSGTVDLDGSTISGANVQAYNKTTDSFVGKTTTDSSGNYSFSGAGVSGDTILVQVQYDDGTTKYSDEKSIELS